MFIYVFNCFFPPIFLLLENKIVTFLHDVSHSAEKRNERRAKTGQRKFHQIVARNKKQQRIKPQ